MTTESISSSSSSSMAKVGRNSDFPWNEFDPEAYLAHNYQSVRDDDRQIVSFVRSFFVDAFATAPAKAGRRGIDVGTGANLYPALAMLPFCDEITLYEFSHSNAAWLQRQRADGWPSWRTVWHRFWDLLSESGPYENFPGDPHAELTNRVGVTHGSVFDLDPEVDRWDVGTMFFVAESITSQETEFRSAVDHFLDILLPNAPFAIAFMEHSGGYTVGGVHFPATAIGRRDVRVCLDHRASEVRIEHVGLGTNPVRDGYTGMLIACGRAKESKHT